MLWNTPEMNRAAAQRNAVRGEAFSWITDHVTAPLFNKMGGILGGNLGKTIARFGTSQLKKRNQRRIKHDKDVLRRANIKASRAANHNISNSGRSNLK